MFRADTAPPLVATLQRLMCRGPREVAIGMLEGFLEYDGEVAMRSVRVPVRVINADAIPTEIERSREWADYSAKIIERPREFNRLLAETLAQLPPAFS